MKKTHQYRAFFYVLGNVLLVMGLTLNTKTGLGVSPVISVAFSFSESLHIKFGITTFVMYSFFALLQMIIMHSASVKYLAQLPFSLLFSSLLNFVAEQVNYSGANHGLVFNLAVLFVAIVLCGVGLSMAINMQLITNPGDGIVAVLAERTGKNLGTVKNCVDVACVSATCVVGLIFAGRIVGIGIGTLCAMVGLGRVVYLVNKYWKEPMCRLSGLIPMTQSEQKGEQASETQCPAQPTLKE